MTTGIGLAVFAAVAFLGGLALERRLLGVRPRGYFAVGFPIVPPLVPLPQLPERTSGRTETVRWERHDDTVLFWADPDDRTAPVGLHGVVLLDRTVRDVHLTVRWSPPWSPLLAAVWLMGLGAVRGEPWLTVPVGLVMIVGIWFVYRSFAMRAAAEVRFALAGGR
jgi:hypothetical protein